MAEGRTYFLEGRRIGLRALEENDINGNYYHWFHDPEVCRFNSHHRFVMSKNELETYIRKSSEERNYIILAVELKENSMHIGNISLQNINYIDKAAEIAFMIGEKQYWGEGYGTEAAILLIDHGFKQLGLERIYFGTSEENIGMQKIGEKLNFKQEGIRRKAFYKNGGYFDIYEYGLLREEWK